MTSDAAQNGTKVVPVPPTPAVAVLSDSIHFHWEKQSFRTDLIFVLPVALCLCAGLAAGHKAAGMIAAGARRPLATAQSRTSTTRNCFP
jgi:hypothetical protein